ncbi:MULTISPECIES: SagB family peptide dehydrogenase [unclassified Paracoccus (in: a-proteobacteria)]|uniref:SagB family peptide dehydrogenase n=1 Tax=unclassified Paracoccus (in: a-proteobacteria) TaxID=2688777 RepID=UPI0007DC21E2|nr:MULTISPECIES: SagB family peptide dehydrogenase [unclassified Paracoccus (in: a-proteobacteria)]
MQTLALSRASDTIDPSTWHQLRALHAAGNNVTPEFGAVSPNYTGLTNTDLARMEAAEYPFSGTVQSVMSETFHDRAASAKHFDPARPVSVTLFMDLLARSFGNAGLGSRRRPYPSGGALYSCQVCLWARNVEGLAPGSYHYLPHSRRLERLEAAAPESVLNALGIATDNTALPRMADCAFALLYCALMQVPVAKYGVRGYRLALLEAGSMYQQMGQEMQNAGLAGRVWGGFEDDRLAMALGVDPRVAWPLVVQFGGHA